jgi:hypothetical protein
MGSRIRMAVVGGCWCGVVCVNEDNFMECKGFRGV